MTREKKHKGACGEESVSAYLLEQGYRILERNFRCPLGEMDIIARDGRTIVFVEVKTRSSRRFGTPQEAIDLRKQRRMTAIALFYLKARGSLGEPARFDVAAVTLEGGNAAVTLYRNAFDAVGF